MRKSKQLSLFKEPRRNTKLWWIQKQKTYGGSMDYRKVERPFTSNALNHIVFKAQLGGSVWFTRSQKSIAKLLEDAANRYGVKLKDFAISRDHIHVLAWSKHRADFVAFLRFFSAEMGRKYKAILKEFGIKQKGSLWIARPFSRIIGWGKSSVSIARAYLQKNRHEALGFLRYSPRSHRLSAFLVRWEDQQQRFFVNRSTSGTCTHKWSMNLEGPISTFMAAR